ncbi:hypothetical protein SmJEL517_g04657 [Synchytrium microbalum]|uniref:Transcription elongation factor SPT5 n=1 Tax=Synchytrium microbalum TaxID=1806994 RepID=A0A507C2P9_9FUNG|nr:uncharacterized protein SmJEL517_g04657 [Synchytrium microbalum]TPX32226.1 hypothetical protein SmJEL517_g04657 [Synchytrium microbalum]
MAEEDDDLARELENEDEELDEEEEDEERPQKKKAKLNPFVDVEAAVEDEEDEDDDMEEDDEPDGPLADEEGFDEEANKDYLSDKTHRQLEMSRRKEEDQDAEKIAARMNQRYSGHYQSGQYRGDYERVPREVLKPQVGDPRLWLLKCVPGKERDIVWSIIRKYTEFLHTKTPLLITSAFAKDNLKGYIYIESDKEAYVRTAIEGLRGLYTSKLSMVPNGEMESSLSIKTANKEFQLNSWVRIKGGKYKGDLARIKEIYGPDTLYLQIIPRMDPTKAVESQREKSPSPPPTPPATEGEDAKGKKRKKVVKKRVATVRGQQKLFSPTEYGVQVQKGPEGTLVHGNDTYTADGFMLRIFKVAQLDTENINPTLEEISMFNVKDYSKELAALPDYVNTVKDFSVGETVLVKAGKSGKYKAIITSIKGDEIRLHHVDEPEVVHPVSPADITKNFSSGDHVKVVNGIHKDETGLIVSVKDNIVSILSDLNFSQFEVFMKDLKLASEIQTSTSFSGGKFDIHDLVDLPSGDVAIVVNIDRDWVTVMNQWGVVTGVKPAEVIVRRASKNAITNDSKGNPIRSGDSVEISDNRSTHLGKRVTVLHVFRSHVFCKSREMALEHGGVFVTRASNTISTKHKNDMGMSTIGGRANPFAPPSVPMSRPDSLPPTPSFAVPRARRHNWVDKTVKIIKGPYKGYLASILDVNPPKARLKLQATNKIVTCKVDEVQNPEDTSKTLSDDVDTTMTARRPLNNDWAAASSTPFDGGRTPGYGGRTPGYGGKTPAYGGRTPGRTGDQTPAWDAGSKTPAWDAGSKTPGYAPRTPARQDDDYWSPHGGPPDRATSGHWGERSDNMATNPANTADSPWTGVNTETPGRYDAAPSPWGFGAPTTPHPSSVPATAQTPFAHPDTPLIPASPYASAATPAATPHVPDTPAMPDVEQVLDISWASAGLEVTFVARNNTTYGNGQYAQTVGAIEAVESPYATVRILSTSEVLPQVPIEYLAFVKPGKGDHVRVITGENIDQVGKLVTIDGPDAVVRMPTGMNIIRLDDLAKVTPTAAP